VYGTLRRGSQNAYALALAENARFISHARIRGRLYRVAHYPGLVSPQSENDWVTGDIFERVNSKMFEQLDDYEGDDYVRQLSQVTMENGQLTSVYVYLYQKAITDLEWIQSGDWNNISA
jgi:gamma-glutamylcyclotransferase (GGCT)/AIG2-like uncharacterized protein YtfP